MKCCWLKYSLRRGKSTSLGGYLRLFAWRLLVLEELFYSRFVIFVPRWSRLGFNPMATVVPFYVAVWCAGLYGDFARNVGVILFVLGYITWHRFALLYAVTLCDCCELLLHCSVVVTFIARCYCWLFRLFHSLPVCCCCCCYFTLFVVAVGFRCRSSRYVLLIVGWFADLLLIVWFIVYVVRCVALLTFVLVPSVYVVVGALLLFAVVVIALLFHTLPLRCCLCWLRCVCCYRSGGGTALRCLPLIMPFAFVAVTRYSVVDYSLLIVDGCSGDTFRLVALLTLYGCRLFTRYSPLRI